MRIPVSFPLANLKYLLAAVVCFMLIDIKGQSLQYESLGIEDGLSQGMIYDIVQTRDGFLWMGTKSGLNRFDGYNFKSFTHNHFDPYSIAENTVTALYEDSKARLWVGLETKGACIYDSKRNLFFHIPISITIGDKEAQYEVFEVLEDSPNEILLFIRSMGVVRVNLVAEDISEWTETNWSKKYQISIIKKSQFSHFGESAADRFLGLKKTKSGQIFVYTSKGAYLLNGNQTIPWEPNKNLSQPPNFWACGDQTFYHFLDGKLDSIKISSNGELEAIATMEISENEIWLSINNKVWKLKNKAFSPIEPPDLLLDASPCAAVRDRSGIIWIGTLGYGLRKLNRNNERFREGAKGFSVWGFWKDTDKNYYVKIINQVKKYDPRSKLVSEGKAFKMGPNRVLDMVPNSDGSIWLLGRSDDESGDKELAWVKNDDQLIERFVIPKVIPTNKGNSGKTNFGLYTYARLLKDSQQRLLFSGLDCIIGRLDPKTRSFEFWDYSHLFQEQAKLVKVYALTESKDGYIWIGTQLGLVRAIPSGLDYRFEKMESQKNNQKGLNNNSISALLPDPIAVDSVLWIGTKGGGLNRLNTKSGLVTHYRKEQGLPDETVYGIVAGQKNELWCSTNRGLIRITLDRHRKPVNFLSFTARQGLQDNEFNTQAFSKSFDGELLFGGINGVNHFYAKDIFPDTTAAPLYLIDLRVNQVAPDQWEELRNQEIGAIPNLKTLVFSHELNNLSFELAVLDFIDPSKNQYRFRLEGVDKDWIHLGNNRFIHFTHLQPGHYTLFAEGSNGEGTWQAMQPINITIYPPWWRTWWAYGMYMAVLLSVFGFIYWNQIRRIKLREELSFQQKERQRLEELETVKNNLFNNITHDFRTPLTMIIEPAQRIVESSNTPEIKDQAQMITNQGRQLLTLTNRLLELAKLESGVIQYDYQFGDIQAFFEELALDFARAAADSGLQFQTEIALEESHGILDFSKTEWIVTNLLSNALKYTPAGGLVKFCIRSESKSGKLWIQVKDNGPGIAPEYQEKVFDRYFRIGGAVDQPMGTGIGLSIVKDTADLLHGEVHLKSETGLGTEFTVVLPLKSEVISGQKVKEILSKLDIPPLDSIEEMELSIQLQPPKILLVEDNLSLLQHLQGMLSSNFEIVTAVNGVEALERVFEHMPDLILSDIHMPIMNGITMCQTLKDDPRVGHIPIVFLTAKIAAADRLLGLEVGAMAYITKPFDRQELLLTIRNIFELKQKVGQSLRPNGPTKVEIKLENAVPLPNVSSHVFPEQELQLIKSILNFIHEAYQQEELSLDMLCDKFKIGKTSLIHKFKTSQGTTPIQYIKSLRMEKAQSLLQSEPHLSVADIAYQVGFNDPKHFSKTYNVHFGYPPSKENDRKK